MMPCPDTQLLRDLLNETLADSERARVECHIETCGVCVDTLEGLTARDGLSFDQPYRDAEADADFDADSNWNSVGDRFRILRRFDGGGQGDVFIARDQELERDVAVKRIKDAHAGDWWRRGSLIREALITGRLEHPGIVPVYGLGYDSEGQSYYAMRLIRGLVESDTRNQTFQHAISCFHSGQATWTLHALLDRFIAVCNTIQYAHDQGVLHCDLKPLNIVLGPYGETLVLDWGAARAIVESRPWNGSDHRRNGDGRLGEPLAMLTGAGMQHLTPAYASPEQLAGRIDELGRTSDTYSLGAMLYCLLHGHAPNQGTRTVPMNGQTEAVATAPSLHRPNWSVPRPLDKIRTKALSRNPKDRYQSAGELAQDVARWLADEPVSACRETLGDRLCRLCRRHRSWALAGAAALLLVTSVSIFGAILVNRARGEAVKLSSEMAEDRGQALCEQGEVQKGVLWLARSLELMPGGPSDLRRLRLAAWSQRLCALTQYRTLPEAADPMAADPGGKYLFTRNARGEGRLWEVSIGRLIGPSEVLDGVFQCSFSNDGSRFLTVSHEPGIWLWDSASGRRIHRIGESQGAMTVATFSMDGRAVLTGSLNGVTRLWSTGTGEPIGPPMPEGSGISAVALDVTGTKALVGCSNGKVSLRDAISGKPLAPSWFHGKAEVAAVALSPDGRTALTGGIDHTARFWSTSDGTPIGQPLEHHADVKIVAFSPDGTKALTSGRTSGVWLWNPKTARPIGRPLQHQHFVRTASFSPDGRLVLTGSDDATAKIWNANNGEPFTWPMSHRDSVMLAQFAPDRSSVLTACTDGTTRSWQLPSDGQVGLLDSEHVRFDMIDTDREIETGAHILDPRDQEPSRKLSNPFLNFVVSSSFDATGGTALLSTYSKTELRNASTGERIGRALRHGGMTFLARMSPDGKKILTCGDDSVAQLWDASTGVRLMKLPHPDEVSAAAFHPYQGDWILATGSTDGTARIWNLRTGQTMGQLMKHDTWVKAVVFSLDGKTILTGCKDGTIWQWDAWTGVPIGQPRKFRGKAHRIVFSPDRLYVLMSSDAGIATVWNLATGAPVRKILLHPEQTWESAFSPSGRLIATTCADKRVRIWDALSGALIGPPIYIDEEVRSLAFSPDERSILTGYSNGKAVLWELNQPSTRDTRQLSDRLGALTGIELDQTGAARALSAEEWRERVRRQRREASTPPL